MVSEDYSAWNMKYVYVFYTYVFQGCVWEFSNLHFIHTVKYFTKCDPGPQNQSEVARVYL